MKSLRHAVYAAVVALCSVFSAEATALPPAEDYLWVYDNGEMEMSVGEPVEEDAGYYFDVDSGSQASISVAGLPSGVAFSASSWTFSGAPSKAGVYYVTISAQNENGYKHSAVMCWTVGDASNGDYDNIDEGSGWLDVLDEIWTGMYFECVFPVGTLCCGWSHSTYSISSISGLPDGLSWNSASGLLSGMPTKPGKYTVKLTDNSKKVAVRTIIVHDSGSAYYASSVAADCISMGTVTGGGVYAAGQTVTFKAVSSKGHAFSGWYIEDDIMVSSSADYVRVADGVPMLFEARFIAAQNDMLSIWCEDGRRDPVGEAVDYIMPFGFDSVSACTVSVKGLPDGLAFDAESQTVNGIARKEGVYYVTLVATNANGYAHSATMRWFIGGAEEESYDDIGIGIDVFDGLMTGYWFEWEGSAGLSVTGLPPGLSRDAKTGVISGVPTKAGKYTITFTDSARQKAVRTIIVQDSGSAYLSVAVSGDSVGFGSVTGSGVYPIGTYVGLSAAATKDAAFAYWDRGGDWLSSDATHPYMVSGYERVEAHFIPAASDFLYAYADDVWTYVGDDLAYESFVGFDSSSPMAISVSGLPPGIVFDDLTRTFSGSPTKQGIYRVSVAASNANGYKVTAIFRWLVGDPYTGEFPSTGDYDNIGIDMDGFDDLQTGAWFEWWGPSDVSVTGLPDGLVRDAMTGVVAGVPTKPGWFTVTFTDASRQKAVRTIRVRDSGYVYVTAAVANDCIGLGTVTGSGLFAAGGSVTLKATAAKDAAFAGWYLNGEFISGEAVCTYSAGIQSGERVEARFIAAANDRLWVDGGDGGFEVGVPLDPYTTADWFFALDSGSAATLAISGLPTGLKYDAKTKALTGTPTKVGVYYVTASAANANGYAHSVTVRWFVGDAQEESHDNIGLDLALFDDIYTGQPVEWYLGTVSQLSGLPQGLSYNARTGMVTGMPSKPGKYTLTATDMWRNTAEKTFIVRDSGSAYVNVSLGDGCEGLGSVAGSGVYPIGSTVTLSATPAKPFCFAGWYVDPGFSNRLMPDGERDWREPQTEFVLSQEMVGMPYFARFIAPEDDYLYLGGSGEWDVWPDDDGGAIFDASWFEVDSATLPNVSAKGLPAGLAMSGGRIVVSDASKLKPGTSTVTLTVSTPSGLSSTRTVTVTLGFPVLTVMSDVDEFGMPIGTVSGGGAYWAGSKATLKATSGKNAAFAGWYRNGEELVSTSATFTYITASFDEYIVAKFISAAEDWLYVEGMEMSFGVKEQVLPELEAYFAVSSGSSATISVSGLPTGVKFDAKTGTFSGAPTKSGVYYVTASAKNVNGYVHSSTVRWFVGDAHEEFYDNIGLDLSVFDELYTGMPFEWYVDKSVSVKGLPTGLSRDTKTGMVSGSPTKPGKYTLTFSDSSRGKAVKTVIVHDSGSAYVDVRVAEGDDGLGEATGGGVYAIGSKVKISAKAAKAYYFAGWYLDYGCDEPFYDADGDWRSAGLSVTVFGPTTLFAKFISPDEDYLWIGADEEWYVEMDDEGNLLSDSFWFDLESATAPTVTAKGLPAGMAVDGQFIVVSSQSKLVPGVSKVTLTAKNLTGMTGAVQVTVRVPNLRSEAFAAAGLDDMYSFYGGVVANDMSGVFSSLASDGWKISVSGLPTGLKYDSKNGVISGTATKAGNFTVYFTATKGKEKQVATATFEVVFPVLELTTGAWGDESASGTVTGGGEYPAGTKVTLKATPAKGCVFAGWHYDDGATPLDGGMDYRTASYTYVTGEEDVSLVALFATAEEDSELYIDIEDGETLYTNEDGSFELDLGALVSSITVPSLTVKGLPTGLKFDSKANAISGTTTKPGKYAVTVSATNGSVKKAVTASFTIVVPNIISPYLPGLDPDESAYRLAVGIVSPDELIDLTADDGWTVSTVSGLPAGMKFNSKTGTVSGTPTKSGAYTVTITAKNGKATTSATITLNVFALPDWAQGTFTGLATADSEYGIVHGYVTMTVSSAGKVSGKIASLGGASISFTAAGFDVSSEIGANDEEWNLFANATAKIGKTSVDVPVYISRAEAPEGLANAVASISSEIAEARLLRTMWADKSSAAAAKAVMQDIAGVYTAMLASDDVSGYLSMTLGTDGNLKATGKLPDGTAVSVSTPLVYDEGVFSAVLSVAPKAYKGGDASVVVELDPASRVMSSSYGSWSSFDPAATSEYGEGLVRELSVYGAYYDKAAKLSDYYSTFVFNAESPILEFVAKYTWYDEDSRKKVTESMADVAEAAEVAAPIIGVDAKGTSFVVPKATKPVQDKETKEWLYLGDNDGAVTLTFTQATGLFKGTYTFWYDYVSAYDDTTGKSTVAHTSKKVSFEGVMLQGESLAGFYLWDATGYYEDEKTGKVKTYTYKQSLPVTLEAQ